MLNKFNTVIKKCSYTGGLSLRYLSITTSNKQQAMGDDSGDNFKSRFATTEAYKGGLSVEEPPKKDDWP